MPWKEARVQEERMRFVAAVLDEDDDRTMAELCRVFGVSRKTGYKLLRRYEQEGADGLEDRRRTPRSHPNATPAEVESLLVAGRLRHRRWGPRKLLAWLARQHPDVSWPAPSTVGQILKRRGLVAPRRKRIRTPPSEQPFSAVRRPNDVWCADFKGWFRTGDGRRCDPLTITDAHSRYLLECEALPRPSLANVRPCFERAFRRYGLPSAIRTDNGTPFASNAVGGLSQLSAWWVSLDIRPERIEPGKPQQNGRHERMHLTLKLETASPPRRSLRAQQRAFNAFVLEYNEERPHEALGNATPSELYEASSRRLARKPIRLVYPSHFIQRRVRGNGCFKFAGQQPYLTSVLKGYRVGLHQVGEGRWDIFFGPLLLGHLDKQDATVVRPPILDRRRRRGR
jgi:transposase InsO family protein